MRPATGAALAWLVLMASACGGQAAPAGGDAERPTIVVTTSILGDVVANLVGDASEVITIMAPGTDPHSFQTSAQQVAQIGQADVLIVNGAGFEAGLLDVIEPAAQDGVAVYEAITGVTTIDFDSADADHGDHDEDHGDDHDEDHDNDHDEDHDDDHGHEDHGDDHGHEGVDPHFFTDPARMAVAAQGIGDFLAANLDEVATDALASNVTQYVERLHDLDVETADALAVIADRNRVLVTNHEVFGYFAERYDFEVIGAVIPGGGTADSTGAQQLVELAELVRDRGVPAIFAETSASTELAETLAAEVDAPAGAIRVVELYSESLGAADSDGSTYIDMMRANVERIVDALAG